MQKSWFIIFMIMIAKFSCAVEIVPDNTRANANAGREAYDATSMDLFEKAKVEYDNSYNSLFRSIVDNKAEFRNHDEFLDAFQKNKTRWDDYIVSECSTRSLLEKEYSDKFLKVYNHCMIDFYKNRADFYRNYKFKNG